jgi:hypothetical protein
LSAQEWFEQKITGKWICWHETGARRIGKILFSNFSCQMDFPVFFAQTILVFTFLCSVLSLLLCILLLSLLIKFLLIRMQDDKYTNVSRVLYYLILVVFTNAFFFINFKRASRFYSISSKMILISPQLIYAKIHTNTSFIKTIFFVSRD